MPEKTDNRTVGGRFEQELAEILYKNGYWVHVLQQNKSGQPADIIAIKGKFHTLIDCKVISDMSDGFPFSRIEENQALAMSLFTRRAYELCYFALKLPDGEIRMVSFSRLMTVKHRGNKRLVAKDIETQTWSLEKWLEDSHVWSIDV